MYPAKVMFPGEIDSTVAELDPRAYPLRMLAEGDSWFSFGSWRLSSLLDQLRLPQPAAIVSLAHPGATLRRMSEIADNAELDNWLSTPYSDVAWNALLVSGGGNDIMKDAKRGLIVPVNSVDQPEREPEGYLDLQALDMTLAVVRDSFARIVELRDRPESPCIGVPLITHEYDFMTPRNAPARFLVPVRGPWLHTAMTKARIPRSRWNAVSDFVIGALGLCLQELEGTLPNFHVARTQGTLTRARMGSTGKSNDWDNEIHPDRAGFRKLAPLLQAHIQALT
jgi:hypothetical protein